MTHTGRTFVIWQIKLVKHDFVYIKRTVFQSDLDRVDDEIDEEKKCQLQLQKSGWKRRWRSTNKRLRHDVIQDVNWSAFICIRKAGQCNKVQFQFDIIHKSTVPLLKQKSESDLFKTVLYFRFPKIYFLKCSLWLARLI